MTTTTDRNPAVTLVLGGARSGKSEVAEEIAGRYPSCTYVATGTVDADDPAWTARIDAHRARRPASWATVEVGGGGQLAAALEATDGPLLVDSLGTWVAGHPEFAADLDVLIAALGRRSEPTIVVSDEVGLGVHPSTEVGGRFRDALGTANRRVAAVAGTALLVVAGRTLDLG